jgi:type I restriction enzyme S subunit
MEVTTGELKSRRIEPGDLLLVEGHAQLSQLGRAAIAPGAVAGYTFQNHLFRVRADPAHCLNGFVCAYVNGPSGRAYFRSFGGTTSGLNTVSAANVKSLPLRLPPVAEQRVIVGTLDAIAMRINAESHVRQTLAALKNETGEDLLSGRIRVADCAVGTVTALARRGP